MLVLRGPFQYYNAAIKAIVTSADLAQTRIVYQIQRPLSGQMNMEKRKSGQQAGPLQAAGDGQGRDSAPSLMGGFGVSPPHPTGGLASGWNCLGLGGPAHRSSPLDVSMPHGGL